MSVLIPLLLLAGCGAGADEASKRGDRTPTVGYVIVQQSSEPMVIALAGRASAFQSSDVRPQVSGVIRQRFFTEGSLVRKGQPLYEIDPQLYRATVAEAQANLASARASAVAAQALADRYKPLAEIEAISKQDYTNAVASARQAQAAVAQNQAQLDTARINLRFTTVPAPISGRIGRSRFTVGALVTQNQVDPLAQISQLDPMFVDIQQSSADLLALRRSLATGGASPASAAVRLELEDGSAYGFAGTLQFTEALVDPSTGTVTLRARFPNPQGMLLPGMFVRATLAQAIDQSVYLVPQQAVSRDPKGNATLFVVGKDGKAAQRTVKADRTQGRFWVVTDGLAAGERIIVQGVANLRPGQAVKAVPASAKQTIAPPPSGDAAGNGSRQAKGG